MSLIEQTLRELEACYLTGGPVTNGEMVRVTNDLTATEVERLLDLFNQIRQQVGHIRRQFHLRPQTYDVRRMVAARFSHFWATLHDCRTSKLKGTGRVDPRLKQALDPAIDQLINLAEELERVIQERSGTGPSRQRL
ncbi:MAG: hypothetical protein HY314_03375 [Acidobacteria bacterium]|nr:hypothetical protein [Acidobacteriota bacterium]